jgi:hypothetical protein
MHENREISGISRSYQERDPSEKACGRDAAPFNKDPRGGPWASILQRDHSFVDAFISQKVDDYSLIVAGMARTLLDRNTAPGA